MKWRRAVKLRGGGKTSHMHARLLLPAKFRHGLYLPEDTRKANVSPVIYSLCFIFFTSIPPGVTCNMDYPKYQGRFRKIRGNWSSVAPEICGFS